MFDPINVGVIKDYLSHFYKQPNMGENVDEMEENMTHVMSHKIIPLSNLYAIIEKNENSIDK